MTKVVFSIEYAGLTLPIGKNADGKDVTPLKPISDLFGLKWEAQREKVMDSAYWRESLGTCTVSMYCEDVQKTAIKGQEGGTCTPERWGAGGQVRAQTCILLERVADYLLSINPQNVISKGTETAATYLINKRKEWVIAIHDYEEVGVAVNLNHIKQQEQMRKQAEQLRKTRMSIVQIIGVKNKTEDTADRKVVTAVIAQMSAELGLPYQPDLLEGAGA